MSFMTDIEYCTEPGCRQGRWRMHGSYQSQKANAYVCVWSEQGHNGITVLDSVGEWHHSKCLPASIKLVRHSHCPAERTSVTPPRPPRRWRIQHTNTDTQSSSVTRSNIWNLLTNLLLRATCIWIQIFQEGTYSKYISGPSYTRVLSWHLNISWALQMKNYLKKKCHYSFIWKTKIKVLLWRHLGAKELQYVEMSWGASFR